MTYSAHFNRLTPAEAERLAMLAEEAGEIVQAVGKILRHGYESSDPHATQLLTNRRLLELEITDIMAVYALMVGAGDCLELSDGNIRIAINRKMRFAHHQGEES